MIDIQLLQDVIDELRDSLAPTAMSSFALSVFRSVMEG